jgi:DNA-binding transcriptional LysR family regulator
VDLVQHLRYFLTVAEELHFGRAAQRLYMAQPPLSQRIRRLEQEYGTALFDRSGGRVRLTPAGAALRREAEQIVAQVDRSITVVRRIASGAAGPLRLGVPPETPGRIVAALSAGFAVAAPDTALQMYERTTAEQTRQLAAGELDVGLLRQPVEASTLQLGPAVAIVHGVLVARTSTLAARPELALGELTGQELILFPRSGAPDSYDEILRICREHGFEPARVQHATSAELVLGLVAAGQGVAFDQYAIAMKEPRVQWRPLVGDPLSWRITVAWPASSTHDRVADFAAVAEAVLGQEADGRPLSFRSGFAETRGRRPWSVVGPTWRDRSA